jgi:P4 family phage/plasmid primase-like protien
MRSESAKSIAQATLKKIGGLLVKLKSHSFKKSVLAEACEFFRYDNFSDILDSNVNLTGVANGVLEIFNDNIEFRAAKPEDYVSMSTNIPFKDDLSWDHPLVAECMTWFRKVFHHDALIFYFLRFASSCLYGKNSDKVFSVWTGVGNNSKSMIVKLFEATLGAYCIKFPITMLTEKGGNASGPSPQLARAKNKRVAFMDEPDEDVSMNRSTIKKLTGGDSFFARLLHDNGGDIEATFKLILSCNKVPIIPGADPAVKRRMHITPYDSRWVDNAPEGEKEQMESRLYKLDSRFERQIPPLAPAFLWIMFQYYSEYAAHGLQIPQEVVAKTDSYWKENDLYAQFINEHIKEVKVMINGELISDVNACLTLKEIHDEFKEWFKSAFPSVKIPERMALRTELTERWGKMRGNSWAGIRFINASQDFILPGRPVQPNTVTPAEALAKTMLAQAPLIPVQAIKSTQPGVHNAVQPNTQHVQLPIVGPMIQI